MRTTPAFALPLLLQSQLTDANTFYTAPQLALPAPILQKSVFQLITVTTQIRMQAKEDTSRGFAAFPQGSACPTLAHGCSGPCGCQSARFQMPPCPASAPELGAPAGQGTQQTLCQAPGVAVSLLTRGARQGALLVSPARG